VIIGINQLWIGMFQSDGYMELEPRSVKLHQQLSQ